jgi:hypothetical protein
MFYSCHVLSFDVCIVTITWSLLFIVIALWVIYLTWQITVSPRSVSGLSMLVCIVIFHRLARKHLVLHADVVSWLKSYSEAPHLTWKCGTRRSDIPIRAL